MKHYLQGMIVSLLSIALVACSSPHSQIAGGTAVGAASGAIVGQALGGNGVLGAIVGGGVGYVISSKQARAINNIERFQGHVFQYGDQIKIIIPTQDLYEKGSAEFTPKADAIMNDLAALLMPYRNKPISIHAYSDNLKAQKNSMSLTTSQAQGLANRLWQKGFNPENLNVMGMGKQSPVSNNWSEKGRSLNRRLEITVKMN